MRFETLFSTFIFYYSTSEKRKISKILLCSYKSSRIEFSCTKMYMAKARIPKKDFFEKRKQK